MVVLAFYCQHYHHPTPSWVFYFYLHPTILWYYNPMNKFTQKWTIIIPIEPIYEGLEYEFTEWPLHITLASVFAVSVTGDQLGGELQKRVATQKSLTMQAESEDWFGPERTVGVMKLQMTPAFSELYTKVHELLIGLGASFNEPQYEGEGYIPHSAHQKAARLHIGDQVTVNKLALIDMFPDGNGYRRRVTKLIDLA